MIKELKYKIKKKEKKYLLYNKYFFKVLEAKKKNLYFLKKNYIKKKFIDKDYAIKKKEFSWRKIIKNENPVVAQEKQKERALHRAVVSNKIFKFSLQNYYMFNHLLKDFTLKDLYYHSFLEKKNYVKYLKKEKENVLYNAFKNKERIRLKEDYYLYKKIINKIKINKNFLKKGNINVVKNYDNISLNKLLNYIMNKEIKDFSNFKNYFKKVLLIKNKKKEKFNMNIFLKRSDNEIEFNRKTNIYLFFLESKKNIIKNEELKEKSKGPSNLSSNYINRSELERFDNKLIFNAVNKYNEENETKIKKGFLNEFKDTYVKKEKKADFNINNKTNSSKKK
jgi:hypothetical protein